MDYSKLFAISAAGMSVERTRLEVATQNLANANTVSSADGGAYQPQRVVSHAVAVAGRTQLNFAERVDNALQSQEAPMLFMPEAVVETTGAAPRRLYEPGHPLADANGFIQQPGVDTATEMVDIMRAMRAYEANVAAANAARSLALKTLDIGSGA